MAPSNQPFTLRLILEKDKLNRTNYADWIRNLRIVLRAEKKEEILDTPLPDEPANNAPAAEKNAYKKACDADLEVSCLMLACMEPDLQLQFDNNHAAHDMIVALNDMFQTQARTERFNVSKSFAKTKLAEGATVGPHVIKMVGYTQRLEKLGFPIGPELATNFILASLPPSYGNFVMNYHMHGAEKGLNELCGRLKIAEADIKKGAGSSHVMAVQNKPKFKKKGNSWKKKKGKAKDEISKPNPPAPKAGPPADAECFHCHGKGHWKRNCKLYLESIKDRGSKGHISENRMKRLHSDGLLTSFDFESYEICEACLLGKMTKTPFIGFPERVADLLELIHTDMVLRASFEGMVLSDEALHPSEVAQRIKEAMEPTKDSVGVILDFMYLSQGIPQCGQNQGLLNLFLWTGHSLGLAPKKSLALQAGWTALPDVAPVLDRSGADAAASLADLAALAPSVVAKQATSSMAGVTLPAESPTSSADVIVTVPSQEPPDVAMVVFEGPA
ncbi:uncharacterized protein [Miscanthus floridulus]|uniref:uncharacterized protein n=1 Tax=Miscanthus floridulus TaxID=154761 RepID=UPI0034581EA8